MVLENMRLQTIPSESRDSGISIQCTGFAAMRQGHFMSSFSLLSGMIGSARKGVTGAGLPQQQRFCELHIQRGSPPTPGKEQTRPLQAFSTMHGKIDEHRTEMRQFFWYPGFFCRVHSPQKAMPS